MASPRVFAGRRRAMLLLGCRLGGRRSLASGSGGRCSGRSLFDLRRRRNRHDSEVAVSDDRLAALGE